jgi:cytochrome c oxidase subunit 1
MPRIVSIYGLTALIILLTSFLVSGSLDIALHDTYFVIANVHIVLVIGLLFVLFTLIVWGINKTSRRLSSVLNWLHYSITTISLVIIAVFTNKLTSQTTTYRDYSVFDEIENYKSQMSINEWLAIILVILILGQVLFLINIIRAFIVKKKSL